MQTKATCWAYLTPTTGILLAACLSCSEMRSANQLPNHLPTSLISMMAPLWSDAALTPHVDVLLRQHCDLICTNIRIWLHETMNWAQQASQTPWSCFRCPRLAFKGPAEGKPHSYSACTAPGLALPPVHPLPWAGWVEDISATLQGPGKPCTTHHTGGQCECLSILLPCERSARLLPGVLPREW